MKPSLFALALVSTLATACDRNPFGFGAGTGTPPAPGGVVPPPPGSTLACTGGLDFTLYRATSTLDACALGDVYYARASSLDAARACAVSAGLSGLVYIYEGRGVPPTLQPVCVSEGAMGSRSDYHHHTGDAAVACVAQLNRRPDRWLRVWRPLSTAGSSC